MNRVRALDIFRGITVALMILVNTPGSWLHIYWPLKHASWHGFTPTDFVFPFFMFAIGSSLYFSLRKRQTNTIILTKSFKRALLLFCIGLFLNAYPFMEPIDQLRIMGVLQRIAICYFFSVLMLTFFKTKALLLLSTAILLFYWLVIGTDLSDWSLQSNSVLLIDIQVFGVNHMYQGYGIPFEPEGLLSSIPATISIIGGYLTTQLLQQQSPAQQKHRILMIGGVLLILFALLWSLWLPINKALWSSSYVLLCLGSAQLLLGCIYVCLDSKRLSDALMPFEIYGTNPLLVYILSWIFAATLALPFMELSAGNNVMSITGYFHNIVSSYIPEKLASLLHALITVTIFYVVSLWFYKRKLFFKL